MIIRYYVVQEWSVLVCALNGMNAVMAESCFYPLRVEFDMLDRLRLGKQDHLLYDVHLVIGIDGLVELSIIWNTEDE